MPKDQKTEKQLDKDKVSNSVQQAIDSLNIQIQSLRDSMPEEPRAKLLVQKQITDLQGRVLTLKQQVAGLVVARVMENARSRVESGSSVESIHEAAKRVYGDKTYFDPDRGVKLTPDGACIDVEVRNNTLGQNRDFAQMIRPHEVIISGDPNVIRVLVKGLR